jgi:hypothetical protein
MNRFAVDRIPQMAEHYGPRTSEEDKMCKTCGCGGKK